MLELLDGDDAVEPLILLLLPLVGEHFSLSLITLLLACIDVELALAVVDTVEPFNRSMDIAWRRLANNCRALLFVVELMVLLRISLIVDCTPSPLLLTPVEDLFGLAPVLDLLE